VLQLQVQTAGRQAGEDSQLPRQCCCCVGKEGLNPSTLACYGKVTEKPRSSTNMPRMAERLWFTGVMRRRLTSQEADIGEFQQTQLLAVPETCTEAARLWEFKRRGVD
jgi:hypothetical protein